MKLPAPPMTYDPEDQAQCRRVQEAEDAKNVKRGGHYDLQSPDKTWWRPSIDNAGTVTWTALP